MLNVKNNEESKVFSALDPQKSQVVLYQSPTARREKAIAYSYNAALAREKTALRHLRDLTLAPSLEPKKASVVLHQSRESKPKQSQRAGIHRCLNILIDAYQFESNPTPLSPPCLLLMENDDFPANPKKGSAIMGSTSFQGNAHDSHSEIGKEFVTVTQADISQDAPQKKRGRLQR